MGTEIDRLNICCNVLGDEKFGSLLDQAITLINDAKTKLNGHTHAVVDAAPNTALITAAVVDTVNSVIDMNLLCRLGETKFGTQINAMVTLLNELRADFNTHGHSATSTVATEQLASADMAALSVTDKEIINSVCISLGDPKIGTRLDTIVTLLTELRSDYNLHVHPTLITNPTDLTTTAVSVQALI